MVIGMTVRIVEWVPPAQETEQIHEELVQPLRAEDGAITEFVWSHSRKKSPARPVRKERHSEAEPVLMRPKVINQGTCAYKNCEVSTGLKPSL